MGQTSEALVIWTPKSFKQDINTYIARVRNENVVLSTEISFSDNILNRNGILETTSNQKTRR